MYTNKNIPYISNSLVTEFEKIYELNDSLQPFIEQQRQVKEMMQKLQNTIPTINVNNSIKTTLDNTIQIFSEVLPKFQIDFDFISSINMVNESVNKKIIDSFTKIVQNTNRNFINSIQSPLIDFLKAVDFSPCLCFLQQLRTSLDGLDIEKYQFLDNRYLEAIYKCKWFPFVGTRANADNYLFIEINKVLNENKKVTKKCIKKVDRIILSYYTETEINQIKCEWKNIVFEPHIKKALMQVLNAYCRKEYALVIPFLATMWEGLIKSKIEGKENHFKEEFKKLVAENGFMNIYSDFYITMIISTCYSVDDVIDGVPNRHGIAHSWYPKYPSQKTALNAIILTDFLLKLKPICDNQNMEEN